VLGSGSGGNVTLVSIEDTQVLIDAGLSCREICRRLSHLGVNPEDIDAIIITHAHGDHARGARVFSRRYHVPVYTTLRILNEWGVKDLYEWRELRPDDIRAIGDLSFQSLVIPHDASETLAFRIDTPDGVIGFATDIGVITSELVALFRECRVLVMESNHATDLLRVSPYSLAMRTRIASSEGHLSNEELADFIRNHLGESVSCIVLVHLSRVNNAPAIAELTCREALVDCGREDVRIVMTFQDKVAQTIHFVTAGIKKMHAENFLQEGLPFSEATNAQMTETRR